MPNERQVARNAAIVTGYQAGESVINLARRFRLTRERIYQILRQDTGRGKRPRRDPADPLRKRKVPSMRIEIPRRFVPALRYLLEHGRQAAERDRLAQVEFDRTQAVRELIEKQIKEEMKREAGDA